MEKIKVLLAEDEPFLGKIVKESLELKGFEVYFVQDGLKAYSAFRTYGPDICVLDVMMPEKDGFTLTEDIRRINEKVPIIFLTAKSLTEDVIAGFECGGNDYLKKPFSMEELVVRMNALLNRLKPIKKDALPEMLNIGLYQFNYIGQELRFGEQTFKLSFREAALLRLLMAYKNEVLNRNIALQTLWGEDNFFNARSMDVFITKLRKYLKWDKNIAIVNVRGIGYKLIINKLLP